MALVGHACAIDPDRTPVTSGPLIGEERQVGIYQKVENRRRGFEETVTDFNPHQNGEQHHQGERARRCLTKQGIPKARKETQGPADLKESDKLAEGR